MLEKHQ
jgi:hypothetical protein